MFPQRADDWTVARWRQVNVPDRPLDFDFDADDGEDGGPTPLWKDLTVASGLALALWAIAAVLFLG